MSRQRPSAENGERRELSTGPTTTASNLGGLCPVATIAWSDNVFQIKICGVRLEEDVRAVEQSGADAIGLNFFPPSVRYLDPDGHAATELARSAAEAGLTTVGVFVNRSAAEIAAVATRLELDAVQLHGDEPPATAETLVDAGWSVVRALKIPVGPFQPAWLEERAQPWVASGCHLLLDADAGRRHGGSGKTLDWSCVRQWAAGRTPGSWTLAGGLKPENVAAAIEASAARSVDTASGVECPRGVKNAGRVRALTEAARAAFGRSP
jgi:phosphoribosylanthranilate isomerase